MQTLLFEPKGAPINGDRLTQAREYMGLTQTGLADLLSVDQTLIAHIERGTRQPGSELLSALAEILSFPESFFRQKDCIPMPKGTLLFRSKAVVGRRAIATHYQHSRLAVEFAIRLSEYAELLPIRLPSVGDPIEAAREVREILGIKSRPFPNVLRNIEKLGVLAVPLLESPDCDGFATWAGQLADLPVIALASQIPFDRHRLTAAHELGHLVLHRGVKSASKEVEEEAYTFAAELLMPAEGVISDLQAEKLTLFRLASLKSKWQVSMQAIARRARELQVISDRQYRYLMMQMSQRGWRMAEPSYGNHHAEKPRAIGKLVEIAFGSAVDWKVHAVEFGLSSEYIETLLSACEYIEPLQEEKAQPKVARKAAHLGPVLIK